ncbi:ATP-binding cassette domain-containing protein [Pedobacter polaris]|uniref:ATP-binding cassette domain-containing protein n=1 Tax=Pedobacter polaris TaxID=2571273 RepID=A0A4U1CPG4_9SPHI|nr:ATP-binding cassette domain-containing protein [Pedobacter polaris]TKC09951.1 ATP-binding cassette domain-containing protein [Pedobacter polaris]
MNDNYIIKTTGLEHRHTKGVKTLTDINLAVKKGEIYGFLGPNGAGKTTTLRLLLGLSKLQTGKIEIFGQEFGTNRIEILKKIGSLIETPSLYGHLRANENLEVYRELYGASKARLTEVLKIVGLDKTGSKKVKQFSLGMKQRLSVALALLPNPELLILDEPANGLDPTGIIELRELVKKLNKEEGMTILMSSHQLSEIEKMVSHVGIISKGEIIFQGSLHALGQLQKKQSSVLIHTSDDQLAMDVLKAYTPEYIGHAISIAYQDEQEIAKMSRALHEKQLDIYLLHPQQNNLEQLFMDLTTQHA